jgi:hypothetical protein
MGNTGIFFAEQFETWYQKFLDDMNDCPLVRGSTLYRLGLQAGGDTPPRNMTVHELNTGETASAEQSHANIMEWMRGADLRADLDSITAPKSAVALDFWGYYDHITTRLKASEEDLLRARGD